MAIHIKTPAEITAMRKGGAILAEVLETICAAAKAGVSTYELDQLAEEIILKQGGKPAFKGYRGFPATLCTAIDEVVVHGIPGKNQILKEGDLFTVDCGVIYDGMYTDAARSMGIGKISDQKKKMIEVAKEALSKGISMAKPGNHVGDISRVIEETIKRNGYHVIYELTGHGVGRTLHEDPMICNYWDRKPGAELKAGMTIAIEPIFSTGTNHIKTLADNWTIVTDDNSLAIQEENTILITNNGSEIITAKKS